MNITEPTSSRQYRRTSRKARTSSSAFSAATAARGRYIGTAKDSLPLIDYAFYKASEEKSLINGVEVAIGKTQDGWHYAQFTYRGAGFQLTASGLTDDEFAASAASLIR